MSNPSAGEMPGRRHALRWKKLNIQSIASFYMRLMESPVK